MNARASRGDAGFSLPELLIAMALSLLVLAAALSMGTNMMAGLGDARRLTTTERSSRIAMEYVSAAIRASSPAVLNGDVRDHQYCSGFGAIQVLDNVTTPDAVSVIHAHGGIVTQLRQPFGEGATSLRVVAPPPAMGSFRAGDHIVVADPVASRGHHYRIEAVIPLGGGELQLDLADSPAALAAACGTAAGFPGASAEYPRGALVIGARIARFSVGTFGTDSALMLDADAPGAPEPLAEGVTDLQIAVAVDRDASGAIGAENPTPDADEWYGNSPGDPAAPTVPGGVTSTPRALSVTLVTQPDATRRRVLAGVIETRNFQGSP